MGKRHFGRVRKLPSGRYQARYPGPDGVGRPADITFARKRDADEWLANKQVEVSRGEWTDPNAGKVPLQEYGEQWIKERPGLRPRTVVLYEGLLRLHIAPKLGNLALVEITTPRLRTWRHDLLAKTEVGPVTVAKAYRLLRAILNTAVSDRLIARNPCQIVGAGQEKRPERPIATLEQVLTIADNVAPRFRAMVLLACFTSMRFGELAALARKHINLKAGEILIERTLGEMKDGKLVFGPPKSDAGMRVVTVPRVVLPVLEDHLNAFTEDDQYALVFIGAKGRPVRRSNFQEHWVKGTSAAGVEGMHFHGLRHTGNTWAAQSGATLRDLLDRMGHASTKAALIYLHRSGARDRAIADALSVMVEEAQKSKEDRDSQPEDLTVIDEEDKPS
jgi:integrase